MAPTAAVSKGEGTGKNMRRTRGPAHQNAYAFRHNPNSKMTAKILASPNEGLCQRCHDKVEWRKKYRKYKPLKAPGTCVVCRQKTVRAAYHTACQPCATARKVCAWCLEAKTIVKDKDSEAQNLKVQRTELERQLCGLQLRQRRRVMREFDRTHGDMDVEAFVKQCAEDDDSDDDFDDEDDDVFSDVDDEGSLSGNSLPGVAGGRDDGGSASSQCGGSAIRGRGHHEQGDLKEEAEEEESKEEKTP